MLKQGNASLSATSNIDGVDVAFFNASFPGSKNGGYSITKNIINAGKYMENQDECDADYADFEKEAMRFADEERSS